MFDISKPSSVRPRGFIDAASSDLPVRVRLTSKYNRPIADQERTAVRISFQGVRTPMIITTPSTSGRTVLGLLVNR